MKPTRDDPHALVDLVDVLLREGAVVDADIVVSVGGVPLVGISLRAAVAGMATMTEYGLLTEWDERQRARASGPDAESPGGRSSAEASTAGDDHGGRPSDLLKTKRKGE